MLRSLVGSEMCIRDRGQRRGVFFFFFFFQAEDGIRDAQESRGLGDVYKRQLKGKLTDLAAQLARVQDENDMIRQRYAELEDAWQGMGDENNSLRRQNELLQSELTDKSSALEASQGLCEQLQEKLDTTHASFVMHRDLASETKDMLIAEQMEMSKKTQEAELLRRESMAQESELRKLRDAWNEREARMSRLEEQRNFYEQELSQLGSSYQGLVDKLSFVVSDYSVRTTPIQVRVGGGYELLSNYMNRVFEEQDAIARRYARLEMPARSPERSSPHRFPSGQDFARSEKSPSALGSPAKSTNNPRIYYEPLQGQVANWPDRLRSPEASPPR
eukprot:TRINITY_DN15730_c0_g4_i3.p1 TRINITY_DN15730_c0_g4~~TRINITY_DN15730_c0_g4_i3.p1  ORF type:complete len:331 (+),score=121.91 TRINITY_DN15730_c0_g4_i3:85-1077(+)